MHEKPSEEAVAVIEALRAHRLTLGLAESCTGGAVAALLTEVKGAGDVIRGGIVAWSENTKTGVLGVDRDLIAEHGIVSAQVAEEMARCAKRVLGADIGFGITGLEGEPADGRPSGLTYLAVATPDNRTLARRCNHDLGARRNRDRDVRTSLQLLQESLATSSRSKPPR